MIVQEPRNAQAYYSIGTMYSRIGRNEIAIEQYKRAVALEPEYKNALFNLASSYGLIGREDLATQYYQRMLVLDGEKDLLDHMAYVHLGEIAQRKGNEAQAREYFKNAGEWGFKGGE
jgi:tetratricopeptide (TPR) repeat protein